VFDVLTAFMVELKEKILKYISSWFLNVFSNVVVVYVKKIILYYLFYYCHQHVEAGEAPKK
jgi:hypothetical protein